MLDKFSNKSLIDKPSFDYGLFWVSMILIGIGLVMVYSSSIALAETAKKFGNSSSYFLIRQTLFICIGAAAGFITFFNSYSLVAKGFTLFIFRRLIFTFVSFDSWHRP